MIGVYTVYTYDWCVYMKTRDYVQLCVVVESDMNVMNGVYTYGLVFTQCRHVILCSYVRRLDKVWI